MDQCCKTVGRALRCPDLTHERLTSPPRFVKHHSNLPFVNESRALQQRRNPQIGVAYHSDTYDQNGAPGKLSPYKCDVHRCAWIIAVYAIQLVMAGTKSIIHWGPTKLQALWCTVSRYPLFVNIIPDL